MKRKEYYPAFTAAELASLGVEARARVEKALRLIEDAQGQIGDACRILSTLRYAAPTWRATSKMYDKVHAHWYYVERLRFDKRVRLDPDSATNFLSAEKASLALAVSTAIKDQK